MKLGPALSIRQTSTLAMTSQLLQAIGLLHFNNAELARFLAHEAEKNRFLEVRCKPPRAGQDGPAGHPGLSGGDGVENLAAPSDGLEQHVERQIGLGIRDAGQQRIARVFLAGLEPYGWLGRDVAEIARECGVSTDAAEAVLALLQKFEPAGLFARSLAECLSLQAQNAGVLDEVMSQMLQRLDLVAENDLATLAELCGCDTGAVEARIRRLQTFDPKPGARFAQHDAPIRPPDLIVTRAGKAWRVEFNASTLPEIDVREDLVQDSEARDAFVAQALASARGLKRAIEQRNANTLAVAAEIVRRQIKYFSKADAHLAPMSRKDVALSVALHESTVSRITTGMTMETPVGIVELKQLFCRGLPCRDGGAAVSVAQIRARITEMIGGERPDRPLSDARIASRLKQEGVVIQRRTIAKYRAESGIPSSVARRRSGPARSAPS